MYLVRKVPNYIFKEVAYVTPVVRSKVMIYRVYV